MLEDFCSQSESNPMKCLLWAHISMSIVMLTLMFEIHDVGYWHILFAADMILVWQECKQLIGEIFGEFGVERVETYWNASLVDLRVKKICGKFWKYLCKNVVNCSEQLFRLQRNIGFELNIASRISAMFIRLFGSSIVPLWVRDVFTRPVRLAMLYWAMYLAVKQGQDKFLHAAEMCTWNYKKG